MKPSNFEYTNTVITKNEKGENVVESETTMTKRKVENEDAYIKLYLKDIGLLHGLANQHNQLLYEIFPYTAWNTHKVLMPIGLKRTIAEKLNTSVAVIDVYLSKLTKKGILIKEGGGVYLLNPQLFGKGDWKSIRELRLTISYNPKTGKRTVKTEKEREPKTKYEENEEVYTNIDAEVEELNILAS
jgi:hypothetical protein